MTKQKVLVAMSGGIDSTVSAILLLKQGFEVIGVTFRVFDSIRESCFAKEKGCCSVESIMEAKHIAQQLGIQHYIVDYRDVFKKCVIDNFVSEYLHARTPNPCVLCNAYIKWGELLYFADSLQCPYIATGHYAKTEQRNGLTFLKKAVDVTKDQTYFLWMIPQEALQRTLFPLGDLTKNEVRHIATQYGLTQLTQKKESQEICFIPNNDYRTFLSEHGHITPKGNYVDSYGNILGQHNGYEKYTIGQRKGLGIALGYPCFVKKIDPVLNQVTLCKHDELYTHSIKVEQFRCADMSMFDFSEVFVRIRYRSPLIQARVRFPGKWEADVETSLPVWGVTPGQSLVFYKDDLLIGGGIIKEE